MGPHILIYFSKGLHQTQANQIHYMLLNGYNVTIKKIDKAEDGLAYDKFWFDEEISIND